MPKKIFLLFTIAVLFISLNPPKAQLHKPVPKYLSTLDTLAIRDTLSVIGVGDIMMGSNYPDDSGLPPEDGRYLFLEVADVLRDADVTMGNLEEVLLDQGGTPKSCRDPKVCYVFRSPERYAQNLAAAGFDVLSVANNHAGDFGEKGTQSTIRALEQAGLNYAGRSEKPFTIFEKNKIKYGFAAFAPNTGCASIHDLQTAKRIVSRLDSMCDVVIISFHGGAEGPAFQHVPQKAELFYGENRGDVYHFAHALIDAGADIVFGHGPHVVRAVELYQNRFIAYSLGNFSTYGGINVAGVNGIAPMIKVFVDNRGNFLQARVVSGVQNFKVPVKLDLQNRAIKKILELTGEDFPDTPIAIDDNGWIRKKSTK